MLEDMLEKYEIINSVGEKIGKIKEVYIDIDTWEIKNVKVSPGIVKKSFLLDLKDVTNVDLEANKMIVKDDFEQGELPEKPSKNMYPYDEFRDHNVVDSEGEKIGKVYSLEIPYHKLKTFKIWKILIKTGFKDRRLRLPPAEIDSVMDNIKLRKKIDVYQETEEESE